MPYILYLTEAAVMSWIYWCRPGKEILLRVFKMLLLYVRLNKNPTTEKGLGGRSGRSRNIRWQTWCSMVVKAFLWILLVAFVLRCFNYFSRTSLMLFAHWILSEQTIACCNPLGDYWLNSSRCTRIHSAACSQESQLWCLGFTPDFVISRSKSDHPNSSRVGLVQEH